MRPNHGWTLRHVSILAVLFLTFKAHGDDSDCEYGINVRRHTKYEADVGKELKIECPVVFCNTSPPTVLWFKDKQRVNISHGHIEAEWKLLHKSAGISYLTFWNIHINDGGLYHCEIPHNMGHNINISVKDPVEQNSTAQENDTSEKDTPEMGLWLYVYCAAGIASFVIVVIMISFISMRGCKGKSKKKTPTENQYAEIGMIEQPFSHGNLHPSPRGSPCVQPPQRSTKGKSPKQPKESRSSRDSEQMKENRDGPDVPDVGDGSVVYAALNHDLPHRPAARPMVVEMASEYAAIRVKPASGDQR